MDDHLGMTTRPIKSVRELCSLVDKSIELYGFIENGVSVIDRKFAIQNALAIYKDGFHVVVERNGEVVSWLLGGISHVSMYSKQNCLSQLVYSTTLSGILAVRAMIMAHRAMISHAINKRVPLVRSNSYMGNSDVFLRVLESDGWTLRGGTAWFPLAAAGPQEATRLLVRRRPVAG